MKHLNKGWHTVGIQFWFVGRIYRWMNMCKGLRIRSNLKLKNSKTKSSIHSDLFLIQPFAFLMGKGEKKVRQGSRVASQWMLEAKGKKQEIVLCVCFNVMLWGIRLFSLNALFFLKSRNPCFSILIKRWALCHALKISRSVLCWLMEGEAFHQWGPSLEDSLPPARRWQLGIQQQHSSWS